MNCTQLQYFCGIDSPIIVNLTSNTQIKGKMASINRNGVKIQTDIGSFRFLRNEEIVNIQLEGIKSGFNSPEILHEVGRFRGHANLLVNSSPMGFQGAFHDFICSAIAKLENNILDTGELLEVLHKSDEIKKRNLSFHTAKKYVMITKKYLFEDKDLCRCICFLLWYGARCNSEAMAVLTSDLVADEEKRTDELYYQLGLANQLIGKADAMTIYWLNRYYKDDPKRALAENELCCNAVWLAYLDMCSDLLYYEGLAEILMQLAHNGSEESYRCAYSSLYRLFSRSCHHTLSREAVAALMPDNCFNRLTRSVEELTIYLKSDKDGYCFFAAEATEMILRQNNKEGIIYYTNGNEEYRCGYLYDYTSTRHHGYILGYDLMTYFLPSTAISEKRKREIKKGFDLSQYNGERVLMEPFVFHAESSFRRGGSYTIIELL